MCKYIFLILVLSFKINLNSQNVWEMTEWRAGGDFETLECIDSNNCFSVTRNGRVLYSSNQGKSWKILLDEKVGYRTGGWIESTAFIDTNEFFLVDWKGIIFSTSDGGKTFDSLDIRENSEIYGLKMFNKYEGLATVAIWNVENPRMSLFYTKDSWKSWDTIISWENTAYIRKPFFHNDDLLFEYSNYTVINPEYYLIKYSIVVLDIENKSASVLTELPTLNTPINTMTPIVAYAKSENYYFKPYSISLSGKQTSYEGILKYNFKTNTWRKVLELYYTPWPWDFQDISFKNDSVGIVVGNSKILYTYDAGESWYYESNLDKELFSQKSMYVEYAGNTPIIASYGGSKYLIILKEDNLAPQPQDTLIISGYVMDGDKPQVEVPVALDNRITMTDSNGFYKFIHIRAKKEYNINVLNKYYSYTPYSYLPKILHFFTTKDTMINFQAKDEREYYNFSGNVVDDSYNGLEDIAVVMTKVGYEYQKIKDTVFTNKNGYYLFENMESFNYEISPFSDKYTFKPQKLTYKLSENISTPYYFIASPITSVEVPQKFQVRDNVLHSEEIAGLEYYVYSLSGITLKSGALPKELDLNIFASGTYILNIRKDEEIIYTYKFQVVR